MNYIVKLDDGYGVELLLENVSDIQKWDNFIHFLDENGSSIASIHEDHIVFYKRLSKQETSWFKTPMMKVEGFKAPGTVE